MLRALIGRRLRVAVSNAYNARVRVVRLLAVTRTVVEPPPSTNPDRTSTLFILPSALNCSSRPAMS
jgi:hypothetical protein